MVDLSEVVALVESGGDQLAERFEPEMFCAWQADKRPDIDKWIAPVSVIHGRCSRATAARILCSSFGTYQIMGLSLYGSLYYRGRYTAYLGTAQDQLDSFYGFLRDRGIEFTVEEILDDLAKRALFADRYNGSANQADYQQRLLAAIARLTAAA